MCSSSASSRALSIGKLVKALPTSVFATAMRPSITRRDLEGRAEAIIETLRAVGANLGVASGRQAVEEAAEPLEARGIVVYDRGRFRVRDRNVLRYYARTIEHLLTSGSAPHALMLDVASKAFFQTLSRSRTLKTLASRYGMSGRRRLRAGSSPARPSKTPSRRSARIEAQGLLHTLDYLGESVTSLAAAETATREYLNLIEEVDRAGVERNLSLKLTQLGLDVDRAICVDNLRRILATGERCGFFVRIDMESSKYTEATLDIFRNRLAARQPQCRHRPAIVPLQD